MNEKPVQPVEMQVKKMGMTEMVEELYKKQTGFSNEPKASLKARLHKLPFAVRMQEKRIAKRNRVLVFLLRTNRSMQIKIAKRIEDGIINLEGKDYECTTDFIYLYNGKVPAIVLPEWSMIPVGTKDYYDAVIEKRIADPQTLIIKMMKKAEVQMKKKFEFQPWMFVVMFLIIGVAAYFFIAK